MFVKESGDTERVQVERQKATKIVDWRTWKEGKEEGAGLYTLHPSKS